MFLSEAWSRVEPALAVSSIGRCRLSDADRFTAGLSATQTPVCDDCLAAVVGWGQRQRANAVGRRLLAEGKISRNAGVCQKCGRRKTVSGLIGASSAAPKLPASQRESSIPTQVPRLSASGAPDPNALQIHDPRARDYYYVVPRAGGWQVVSAPKGEQLPSEYNSVNYSYAEKMTYGEVKALENKILAAQRREERAAQQAATAKKRKKPHTLFWLLFGAFSRDASNGISKFLRGK